MIETHLKTIVRPTSKFHDTCLFIKREVLDVHLARGVVDCGRFPLNITVVKQGGFCGQGYFKVSISTVKNLIEKVFSKKT